MNTADAIRFKLAVEESELFVFKKVLNGNINRMSPHVVVKDIPYLDFIVKLKHQDTSWREDI